MRIRGLIHFWLLLVPFIYVSCEDEFANESLSEEYADTSIPDNSNSLQKLRNTSDYLVVYGDLQSYTLNNEKMVFYKRSLSWIDWQLESNVNINAILEVGDVSENNLETQWKRFYDDTYGIASRIPYYVVTGNHDYDWHNFKIKDRRTTFINKYADFSLTRKNIIAYFEEDSLENYVAIVNYARNIYLLALEFGPREEVLNWAKLYVQNNSDKQFILMTHEWLTRLGERIKENSFAEAHFKGYSSFSTPEDVWNKLVYPNDNILCVLCGHNGFSAKLFSENEIGRKVPQILFNLQYQTNGGNGLVQLWEFPHQSDSVRVCAYDTINDIWFLPDSTTVTFKYNSI